MSELLSRLRAQRGIAEIAEWTVMLFVAAMTGISTLRLLGLLP